MFSGGFHLLWLLSLVLMVFRGATGPQRALEQGQLESGAWCVSCVPGASSLQSSRCYHPHLFLLRNPRAKARGPADRAVEGIDTSGADVTWIRRHD